MYLLLLESKLRKFFNVPSKGTKLAKEMGLPF